VQNNIANTAVIIAVLKIIHENKEVLSVKNNTRIYNRFEYWSVADCACDACLYWNEQECVCSLTACYCEDIRQEATRREQAAVNGSTTRTEAASCPA
jgi:hypothetical protein